MEHVVLKYLEHLNIPVSKGYCETDQSAFGCLPLESESLVRSGCGKRSSAGLARSFTSVMGTEHGLYVRK